MLDVENGRLLVLWLAHERERERERRSRLFLGRNFYFDTALECACRFSIRFSSILAPSFSYFKKPFQYFANRSLMMSFQNLLLVFLFYLLILGVIGVRVVWLLSFSFASIFLLFFFLSFLSVRLSRRGEERKAARAQLNGSDRWRPSRSFFFVFCLKGNVAR